MLLPVSQHSPQGYPQNSANVCLVEHRLFPTSEVGRSVTSFLHFSFFQAINAGMIWPIHVQKFPQASERLCLPVCLPIHTYRLWLAQSVGLGPLPTIDTATAQEMLEAGSDVFNVEY